VALHAALCKLLITRLFLPYKQEVAGSSPALPTIPTINSRIPFHATLVHCSGFPARISPSSAKQQLRDGCSAAKLDADPLLGHLLLSYYDSRVAVGWGNVDIKHLGGISDHIGIPSVRTTPVWTEGVAEHVYSLRRD
jgi:hypothetical protein